MTDAFAPFRGIADWLTYSLLGLERGSHMADSVNFFAYDGLKIVAMLIAISYLMAAVRHYLPAEKISTFLSRRRWYGLDYFFAAMLGAVTPFCSCSSIPLFVGFVGVGIPIGVTMTFLIASPLISEVAAVVLLATFGVKVAAWYVATGMLVSMLAGLLLSKVNVAKHISGDILEMSKHVRPGGVATTHAGFTTKLLRVWLGESLRLTKKLLPFVLIGIGLGAVMHGYVPQDYFAERLGGGEWWTVPLATVLAIPLYANGAGVVPIMQVLVAKGIPLGTAMAFLMATIGLSLPEALILRKVMSMKLLTAFYGLTAAGIMIVGFVLNILF